MTDNIFESSEAFHEALANTAPEVSEATEGLPPIEDTQVDDLPPLDEQEEQVEAEVEEAPVVEEETLVVNEEDLEFEPDEQNKVPVGRLKKEANKRKEIETQLQQQRDEYIRTQTELDNIKKALEIYNQDEPSVSQEGENNLGYDPIDTEADKVYKSELKALKDEIATLKGASEQTNTSMATQAFSNTVAQQQAAFEAQTPDFGDAFKHLGQAEYNKALRLTGDEAEATQMAGVAVTQIAAQFYQNGKDVAENIYELAKDYGYQPKAAAQAKPKGANLDAIQKNMSKASGLGSMQSAAAAPTLSNASAYMRPENVNKIQTRAGGPIDPAKFKKILAKVTHGS